MSIRLHEDKTAFRVLLERTHERTGYRTDILEKDYYVVLILTELADKQSAGLPAYFKGGTALYKALKTTNRFSEDPLGSILNQNRDSAKMAESLLLIMMCFSLKTVLYKSLAKIERIQV